MLKTAKSVLADSLKPYANPMCAIELQYALHAVDGGQMLHSVVWPKECTYQDLINEYVSYVMNSYGHEALVCFDSYSDRTMSTKVAEQCRRTTGQNVSPDILFELDMQVACGQHTFLGNHKDKARFISVLMTSLTNAGIECCQSQADADYLICSSAIELAGGCDRPVVLVGKDTDLLVMLINISYPNLYMQYARNVIYSINSIMEALSQNVRDHLLVAHTITGCDTVSALYKIGKKTAINVLEQEDWGLLDLFKRDDATHIQILRAAERFVLKLYNANDGSMSLDHNRFVLYMR